MGAGRGVVEPCGLRLDMAFGKGVLGRGFTGLGARWDRWMRLEWVRREMSALEMPGVNWCWDGIWA